MASAERIPFVIIGENVHATRSLARQGKNIVTVDGVEAVAFKDAATGADRTCPISEPVAASAEFAKNKVKHIRNALLLGLGGDKALESKLTGDVSAEAARAGRDYLIAVFSATVTPAGTPPETPQRWPGATFSIRDRA